MASEKNPTEEKEVFNPVFHPKEIPWNQSMLLKGFFIFLSLAVIPTVAASFFIMGAYGRTLSRFLSTQSIIDLQSVIFAQVILLLIFFVIISAFIAFFISRYVGKPIEALIRAIRRIARNNFDARIDILRKDEFGELISFFNGMTRLLKETRERDVFISEIKSQFVSIAAHQLRTPLAGIKWTLRLILDGDLGQLNQKQKEFLERSYDTNEQMIHLINDLLNTARIEEGRFDYNFRQVDLGALMEKIIANFASETEKDDISIDFVRFPRILVIPADPDRVAIAFSNILDNALRYSLEKGHVKIWCEEGKDFVTIVVQDHGIGIPHGDTDKLFNRFYRAPNALKRQTEGSGLGLFIARNIIKRHGGDIWFVSEEGKGSTFFFTLPLRKDLIPGKSVSPD